MKNNMLTYVLYGLLGVILIVAGYYACQKQKETKLKKAQDEAELQQTLKDMGYAQSDTSASAGSSFVETGSANKTTVNKDGIEVEPVNTATKTPATATKAPATTTTTPAAATQKPAATTTTVPNPAAKVTTANTTAKSVAGPGTGRWAVRAGTFAYMEGARRRLEEVIKLGYRSAEISKTSDGKAAVVVFRSNNKAEAIRVVDKLEEKNIDAAVFDRQN